MHYCGHTCCVAKAKAILLTVLLVNWFLIAGAQTEKYIQLLTGNLKKGDSCVVTDDKFREADKWASIEKRQAVNNLVTFELRYDTAANYFNRSFACTLLVDIEYETADRIKQQLKNVSLEVNYDTSAGSIHQGIAYCKFKGGHHVKLTINKISSVQWGNKIPPVFRIRNEIFIERLYTLNTEKPAQTIVTLMPALRSVGGLKKMGGVNSGSRADIPGEQQTINWDAGDPAFPQYDFEWSFYDDNSLIGAKINSSSFSFSPDELVSVFKNNNSRVTVSLPGYQLNLLYNRGWIFYRVRGARYDEITGERTTGAWSYAGSYPYNGNTYGLLRCNGHEEDLNWQYNGSFAEEGKRKEVVSYFDGSLRNRQSVTLNNDNTGSIAIVQENVFDAQGRAAVNILPAPTTENTIHYFRDFNKGDGSGLPYSYTDIEARDICIKPPAAMSNSSGAGQYYSDANPRKADNTGRFYFSKYIPDAQGYPFAVSSFTPDNTGRVRTQGGVGPLYQPGKSTVAVDHTSRYFYGKPQQEELDRLFGNEAGNASHYLKNMMIDANGQASVSYINASGKTIATALAGKRPDNLQALPSYQLKSNPFITELTNRDNIIRDADNLSLTYSGTFLATATGSFVLKYDFTPVSLQVLYGIDNNKICADCYYDLQIRITDNCGSTVQYLNQAAVFTEKSTCSPAPTRQEGQLPVTIEQPGEYNITYKLMLSRQAVDYYVNEYLVQDLSISREIDFQRTYIHKLDLAGCFNNCETCLADLGNEQTFISRITGVLQQQINIVPNGDDISWMKDLYKQLINECNLMQQGCGNTEMPCEVQTLQLKEDVTLGGQYMLYDAATGKFTERDINILAGFIETHTAIPATVTINGVTKSITLFTEAEIIANWQDEWAELLLPYHPENVKNCFIDGCGKNAVSDLYDQRFVDTEDVALAATRLYWFGDNYSAVVSNDPYFKTGAAGDSKKSAFLATLGNYKGSGQDIMSFVRWSVYCSSKTENGNYPQQVLPCPRTVDCNREQDEWSLFKTLYYSVKHEILDKNTACNSSNLFPDPVAALLPAINPSVAAPLSCADAAFFTISTEKGIITIQYTGTQKTARDVTVRYFAIGSNGIISNAAGSVVFPAGTGQDAIKAVTGQAALTYVIDYARCDLVHPYYSKTRRNYNGVIGSALGTGLQNRPQAQLDASALTLMINECNESCEQSADGWMQKLQGCAFDMNSAEYSQIREGLISICKSSCQINVTDHPFGASSTTIATPQEDKNFKDVLLRVLGEGRFSAICNDLLLDYPAAIDTKPLFANEVVRTLSSCAYEKLQLWKIAYQSAPDTAGFAAYIKTNIDPGFSLTDAQITSLVSAFEKNCVTPRPVLLPSSLSCTVAQPVTCLTCMELQDEKLNFSTSYSYVPAGDPDYYELLAKYVNRKYSFSLSSVDVYDALQHCARISKEPAADTVSCDAFITACNQFEQLKPAYFTPSNTNADSLYKIHLTLWLNTALRHQLDFEYYNHLAIACNIQFSYPGNNSAPVCDTSAIAGDCIPAFITCCTPFAAMDRFRQVFPDSADARLLALYFALQRTQWCTAVNLPNISFILPYDTIANYFANFRLAGAYNMILRPDSLVSFTADSSGSCPAAAFVFKTDAESANMAMAYALCNKPIQPLLSTDDNSCINQQLAVAVGNAHSDYLEYLEKIKRDYRDAYYIKCLSITPRMVVEAVYNQPQEYHHTLYYYDQSGNLVKTIPPAGVQPVDEEAGGAERMMRAKNFRLADKDYCYEYGDAPAMNGSASITLADNPIIKQATLPFTIEAFVNFSNLHGSETILTKQSVNTADNKTDGYKIYLNNGRLMVDMAAHGNEVWIQTLSKIAPYLQPYPYTAQPPVAIRVKEERPVPRSLYRSLTAQITSDISGMITGGEWVYVMVQNTGDWSNPVKIYINGSLVSSQLATSTYEYTPAVSPALTQAELAAGTTEFSFRYSATTVPLNVSNTNASNLVIGAGNGGLTGSIKQLRIYNRALGATEIRSNASNACLVPQSEGQLVVWLPLNKEEVKDVSIDRINQLVTINRNTVFSSAFQPVYPRHTLPMRYYYNSLNAVARQSGPDGGNNYFFYDLLGRLVVSQNAEQKKSVRGEPDNRYSYTKYDIQGRVIEVGEKTGAATMTTTIAKTDPVITGSAINNWLASGTNTQVTQTIYDQPDIAIVTNPAITNNQNTYNTSRKRVVATIYRNGITTAADYNNATHYQYDINGNVKRLWQEHKKSVTGTSINMLKNLQYDYDLVSGKVNHVIYQQGKGDQFVYKYEYDPDNRLLRAYSGREIHTLQQDAGYQYYLHGPLARMELGDGLTSRIVQGSDYAYTLQGWLKGVNAVQLTGADGTGNDMGSDGSPLNKTGMHAQVGADALAYTLGYHQDDYVPIGGASAKAFASQYQHPAITGSDENGKALFNGNISNATYGIAGINDGKTRAYSYSYDQLNRLKMMRAHDLSALSPGTGWNNGSVTEDHKEDYSYDANGNMATLFRNGLTADRRNLAMDNLAYQYYYYTLNNSQKTYAPGQPLPADAWALTNQLATIKDAVPSNSYPVAAYSTERDIDNQANNNYTYDGIGNLVKDNAEGIIKIGWTVYGKIRSIDKADGTSIVYDYDASGNRVQRQTAEGRNKTITYYIRDAQGNTIAVYSWQGRSNATPAAGAAGNGVTGQTWDEQHLYGSSRLGMWKPGITVPAVLNPSTGAVQVGSKFFELTNHLGNVMAVISDKKIAVPDASEPKVTDHYTAELISANDYTPFGMQMVGRNYSLASSPYRYGFNGKENDNDVKGEGNQQDYGMRIYDGRLGRFLSVDPITADYPMLTPYQFASNSPVSGIDKDGLEYSPAGKLGIYNIDATAVQLYPNHPAIMIRERADAPMLRLSYQVARAHQQPSYLSTQWKPRNEYEKQRYEANKAAWYDRDGHNEDGSAKPSTRLAQNKTWNAFAANLALPVLDGFSYAGGEGELAALIKNASKLTTRDGIVSLVDGLLSSSQVVAKLDGKAIVGYRGSLATGVKYKTGAPFNPSDFDVDAFIVSDKLAKQFNSSRFRNGRDIPELTNLSNELEKVFKKMPGYRTSAEKTFTFRIFSSKEFKFTVKPNGYKAF
ncbi:MAG: RHS repeat-associated core domain-containing protein [Chitinophagaceae bacterium]